MKLNRREFLTLSGKSAAGAVLFAACSIPEKELIVQSPVDMPEDLVRGVDEWYATNWSEGAPGDGILVRILEGRIKKIKGNPDHPITREGSRTIYDTALQVHYNPDRLNTYKVRRSKKGILSNTSESEANKLILEATNKNKKIVVVTNPTKSTSGWVSKKFAKSRGGRYLTYDPLDQYNLYDALNDLFGSYDLPIIDISNSENVLSFGADWIGGWISPAHYSSSYGKLRSGNRGFFAHVEPRHSITSAAADTWLSPFPGTEAEIALSIANVIINEKLVSDQQISDFLKIFPDGKIEYGYNPSDVEKRTGVSSNKIVEIARKISKGKSVVFAGGSTSAYTNGKYNTFVIYALNFLLGSVGKEGGLILNPKVEVDYIDGSNKSNSIKDWQEELAQWRAGYVDTVIIKGVDLVYSMPNSLDVKGALANVENVISFGTSMNETLEASDIIIPETTFFQDWGAEIPNPLPGFKTISLQQPVVTKNSPGTKSTSSYVDKIIELESSLGSSAKSLVKKIFDNEFKDSDNGGSIKAGDKGGFLNGVQQRGGFWNIKQTADQKTPRLKNPFKHSIENTFSTTNDSNDFHLIPFTNNLNNGKLANIPFAQQIPDPITSAAWQTWVEINSHQAEEMGIKEGDIIYLKSDAGEIKCLAYPHPAVQPNTICVPTGQGTLRGGRYSEERGSNLLKILSDKLDPETGSLAWASTKVSVKRAGGNKKFPKFEGTVEAFPVEPGIPILIVAPGETAHEAEKKNHHKYQEKLNLIEKDKNNNHNGISGEKH